MHKIACLPDNVRFSIEAGETILEASLRAGIPHAHACGGRALCSTCRIWVLEGLEYCSERSERERAIAVPLRFGPEVRLACQTKVSGDVKLRRLVLDETDLEITSQLAKPLIGRCGQARTIAVLFCDIRDFTDLSQHLSPYDLMFVLNRYFFHMADAIERNGGHIEKFIGDAIMAIFGIDDTPDMPLRAIKAATDMLDAADRMKLYMKAMYDIDFDVGIGLHYGDAVIGTVSGGREEKLAAIGETVNVASRIESANKEAGTRLLISEALYRQTEKAGGSIRLRASAAARHQRAHVALRSHPFDAGGRSSPQRPRQTRDGAFCGPSMDAPSRRGRDRRRRAAGFRVRHVRSCRSTQGREVLRLQQAITVPREGRLPVGGTWLIGSQFIATGASGLPR